MPINKHRLLVPRMRAVDRCEVIVISPVAAQRLASGFGVYSVSKVAVKAMAHTLASEDKPLGMRVKIIATGLVETDMDKRSLKP